MRAATHRRTKTNCSHLVEIGDGRERFAPRLGREIGRARTAVRLLNRRSVHALELRRDLGPEAKPQRSIGVFLGVGMIPAGNVQAPRGAARPTIVLIEPSRLRAPIHLSSGKVLGEGRVIATQTTHRSRRAFFRVPQIGSLVPPRLALRRLGQGMNVARGLLCPRPNGSGGTWSRRAARRPPPEGPHAGEGLDELFLNGALRTRGARGDDNVKRLSGRVGKDRCQLHQCVEPYASLVSEDG